MNNPLDPNDLDRVFRRMIERAEAERLKAEQAETHLVDAAMVALVQAGFKHVFSRAQVVGLIRDLKTYFQQ